MSGAEFAVAVEQDLLVGDPTEAAAPPTCQQDFASQSLQASRKTNLNPPQQVCLCLCLCFWFCLCLCLCLTNDQLNPSSKVLSLSDHGPSLTNDQFRSSSVGQFAFISYCEKGPVLALCSHMTLGW